MLKTRASDISRLWGPHIMNRNVAKCLVTWPFIVALAMLIINDLHLKAAYPGPVTGKLSDLAGIAVVTIPILAMFPGRRLLAALSIAVLFLWWKSPASEPFILWVNSTESMRIARVVDYTDLLALAIVPACHYVGATPDKFLIAGRTLQRVAIVPIGVLTVAALLGTSQMAIRQTGEFSSREEGSFDSLRAAEIVAKLASERGLKCLECSNMPYVARYLGNGFAVTYTVTGPSTISLSTESWTNFPFPGRGGRGEAEDFREAVKWTLSREFHSLQYVERLN